MRKAIKKRPLAGSFNVGDGFHLYSFGIIKEGSSAQVCENEGQDRTNHAMAIVGYDEDGAEGIYETSSCKGFLTKEWEGRGKCPNGYEPYEKDPGWCLRHYCTKETQPFGGEAFWKIQNSHGDDWGDGGFAYFDATVQRDAYNNVKGYGPCNMYARGGKWV